MIQTETVTDKNGVEKQLTGRPTGLKDWNIPTGELDLDYRCPSCNMVGFVDHPNRNTFPCCTNTDCRVRRFTPFKECES